MLMGKISTVSTDRFERNRTGLGYVEIEVTVLLRKLAALAYLLEPFTQMLRKAGREH